MTTVLILLGNRSLKSIFLIVFGLFCHDSTGFTIIEYFPYIFALENLKKDFMIPFYGWVSTASKLEPLQESSLLFTTNFPEIPGTHFIDLGRMNA